jgi:hypothetical protein
VNVDGMEVKDNAMLLLATTSSISSKLDLLSATRTCMSGLAAYEASRHASTAAALRGPSGAGDDLSAYNGGKSIQAGDEQVLDFTKVPPAVQPLSR